MLAGIRAKVGGKKINKSKTVINNNFKKGGSTKGGMCYRKGGTLLTNLSGFKNK